MRRPQVPERRRIRSWLVLAPALLSCTLPFGGLLPAPTATVPPSPTPRPATPTAPPPTATAAPTLAPTPTTQPVTILASGNLNVRRGPSQAYNVVGFLTSGESATVLGRNEDSSWLYIEIPSVPGRFGWISADSQFASVSGPVSGLPTIPYEAAVPAYLRNCTFHPMLISPGGFTLPPQTSAPDNQRQVNPGHYEAVDLNQQGNPTVFSADLREGDTVDIRKDGLGNTYSCP